MDLKEAISHFVSLAGKESLSKGELAEVRNLMKILKKEGMSNSEISDLSNGRWSESTVKGYTKGVKVSNAASWQNAAALLNKAIAADLTIEDIGNAAAVSDYLEAKGLDLDEVVSFMHAAGSFSIDFVDLIQHHLIFKESGISPYKLAEFLESKKLLEEKVVSLDSMKQIAELAGKFGDTQAVFEALSAYGSLTEVEGKISVTKEELENFHKEIASADQKLKDTQDTLAELAKPLEAYEKALGLGFNEKQLDDLGGLAEKYGGPDAVFQAVKAYVDYEELTNKISDAKSELVALESKVNKLNTEHGHLAAAVKMCQKLITENKFGLDAVSTILSLAEKYGEPVNVLKSVEAYGKLQVMQEELARLEGEVAKHKESLAQLDGKNQGALKQLESLSAIAMETGAAVSKVESRLEESKYLHNVIFLINDPLAASYQEYGLLVVAILKAVRLWVTNNTQHFLHPDRMRSALQDLIMELGGD